MGSFHGSLSQKLAEREISTCFFSFRISRTISYFLNYFVACVSENSETGQQLKHTQKSVTVVCGVSGSLCLYWTTGF